MSNDPKKPLDPSPSETPDILQRDLNLDRRNRLPPSFEPTRATTPATTQPGMPGPFARQQGLSGPTPPVGTVAPGNPNKNPNSFEVAPTMMRPHVTAAPAQSEPAPQTTRAPVNAMPAPPGLTPRAAPAQPRAPQPPGPPRAAPPPPQRQHAQQQHTQQQHTQQQHTQQPNAQQQAPQQQRTALARPHDPARPQHPPSVTSRAPALGATDPKAPATARRAPPSPTQWANRPPAPTNDAPTVPVAPIRVTAAEPGQGASLPSGGYSKSSYAQPHVVVAPPAPTAPEPEFVTAPDRRQASRPPPPPSFKELPDAMPSHLRVTQPEMRNPLLGKPLPVAATPESMSTPPPAGPTRVLDAHPAASQSTTPDFGDVPSFEAEVELDEPQASVDEASPGDVVAAPASLWRRTIAWALDVVLIGLVVSLFFAAALAVIGRPSAALLMSVIVPALGVVGFVAFVYTTLFAFLFSGRTPGRRLLGIHLVDASGHAPRVGRALVRAALSLASFALCLAGFWLALFDRRGQTLHDKLTSTFVVRLKPAV